MWEKIRIKSIKPYRKDHQSVKKDRVMVTLDMPTEVYSKFRKQVEAPLADLHRRISDSGEATPQDLSISEQISQESKTVPFSRSQ